MKLPRRSSTCSLGLAFTINVIFFTWAASSSALQFEIDPTTSTFQDIGGFVGPRPPEPLAGSIVIDIDLGANTATLVSISTSPTITGFLQSELLSLIDVLVPIVANRFVLGDSFTGFDFLLGVDSVEFHIGLGNGLADGPRVTLDGTASVIPEPSTALLLGLGLVGLGAARKRR